MEENKNNELFKKCLRFLLDSNITSGINKSKINKKINKINDTPHINTFNDLMDYVEKHNTGTDLIISTVQHFILNQPKRLQDFIHP